MALAQLGGGRRSAHSVLAGVLAVAVDDAVTSGESASVNAVISDALQDWHEKRALREELRADLRAGMDDIAAARVQDPHAEYIIARGRQRRSALSHSE